MDSRLRGNDRKNREQKNLKISVFSVNSVAKKMAKGKDILTTGEVAKICNVASRTVSKWFDAGLLNGWRLPLSGDRRVKLSDLIRFMKEHGIPYEKQKTEGELPTSNAERPMKKRKSEDRSRKTK